MRTAARIQAAIEILDRIQATTAPADAEIRDYFRSRRYAGGGDRRWTGDLVNGVLRRWHELAWRLDTAAPDGRALMRAHLADGDEIEAIFAGETHGPAALDAAERAMVPRSVDDAPRWARANVPEWLWPHLEARFGEGTEHELAALHARAGVDLRVNRLKADRDGVLRRLNKDGIGAAPTPLAPDGIRLDDRPSLARHPLYLEGRIEVQDEGSQIVAALADAGPGRQVADLCAGAGGKTLALAAAMENTGQIHAFDIHEGRLEALKRRVQRAGVRNVQARLLPADVPAPEELAGRMDRVLVDAPCSGVGTWRRQPEGRLRLTPEMLVRHGKAQRGLLAKGASFTRPGGRLVHAVCSPLRAEGEEVVDGFLDAHRQFRAVPVSDIWAEALAGEAPGPGPYLMLTPAANGTDGFFLAILERTD